MKRSTWVLALMAISSFLVTFDGSAVQMVLPTLHRELGASVATVEWVMTSYLLVSTAALLSAGRAGDVLGRGRVWRAGVALFTVASAACIVAPGLRTLLVTRAAQGLGAAMVSANSAPLLADAYPHARGRALAVGNIAIGLGLVAGPPLGSLLAQVWSWRLLFVVAVPLGAAGWWLARGRLPLGEKQPCSLGIPSGVLVALALTGLLVGATLGREWGYGSPATIVAFVLGAGFLGAFVMLERRGRDPLVPPSLWRRRIAISGALVTLLGFASLFTLTVAMPFFLIVGQGRSPVQAGLFVVTVPVGLALGALPSGWVADRAGSRWPCTLGLLVVAAAFATLALAGRNAPAWLLLVGLGAVGVGLGGFESPNLAAVITALPEGRQSIATALLTALSNLGMTIGTALGAVLLDVELREHAGRAEAAVRGASYALWLGAGLALAGAIAAVFRESPPLRQAARGRREHTPSSA